MQTKPEMVMEGAAPSQHERANRIIGEIKASGLSPKEKRKKLKEALGALETRELEQDFDRESARRFYLHP